MRAIAKKTLRKAKMDSWQVFVSSIDHTISSGSLWKSIRKMRGTHSHQINTIIDNNSHISNPKEICNLLAQSFQRKTSNSHASTVILPSAFHTDTQHPYNDPFTMTELSKALQQSKNSAPGPDSIHLKMIVNLPSSSLSSLLDYYNHLWTNKKFPNSWLHSIIVPIHKLGKPRSLTSSYRPISLTNHMCKVMERMINNRLSWFLESRKLLSPFQYGFRKHYSSIDHLASLHQDLSFAIHRKWHTGLISLDLTNAFDITDKNLILLRLREMGFEGNLPIFILNFLSPRHIQVKTNGHYSNTYTLPRGVPQGSVLSPTLFNIAMTSLTDRIPPSIRYKLFADDIILYHSSPSNEDISTTLQTALLALESWAEESGFSFSPTKSSTIHICHSRTCPKMNALYIHDSPIPLTNSLNILGLTFDSRLNWSPHIKHLRAKTSQDLNLIRSLANTSWGSDLTTLSIIYKSLILSKLKYGDFIYDSASLSIKRSLDSVQNQALRVITGAFRTSPISSLQCISSFPSLSTVRHQSLLRYYITILHRPHLRSSINLSNVQRNLPFPTNSFQHRIRTLLLTHNLHPPTYDYPLQTSFPPWRSPSPCMDFSLEHLSSSTHNHSYIKTKFLSIINNRYPGFSVFYTDGSKSSAGVGAAFSSNNLYKTYKLPSHFSIFSAELLAIKECLRYILKSNKSKKYIIASDSQSALLSISSRNLNYSYSRQIMDLLYVAISKDIRVVFLWIPGHSGIKGNDSADHYAKQAAHSGQILMSENHPSEYFRLLKDTFNNVFQLQWDLEDKPNKLWEIKPLVFPPLHNLSMTRKENTIWRRLALGHTYFTHIHLLKGDPPPLCQSCNNPLTIKHIFESPEHFQNRNNHGIPHHLKQVLSAEHIKSNIHKIIAYLKELNLYNTI